jgi:hypothetical protein
MPRFVWLSLALGLAACPHAAPTAAPPAPAPAIDAGPAVETPAVDAAPPPITADECGAYVDHVLAVALGAMRGTRAADEIPTSEQVATIRAKLVPATCAAGSRGVDVRAGGERSGGAVRVRWPATLVPAR